MALLLPLYSQQHPLTDWRLFLQALPYPESAAAAGVNAKLGHWRILGNVLPFGKTLGNSPY